MTQLKTWHEHMCKNSIDSYSNYGGSTEHAHMYVVLSTNRDASILQDYNYRTAIKMFSELWDKLSDKYPDEDRPWADLRFNHWGVGWIELLMVEPHIPEIVSMAEDIIDALNDYPILGNDDEYYDEVYAEKCKFWEDMDMRWRIDLCNKAEISIFAARHDYIPDGVEEYIEVD